MSTTSTSTPHPMTDKLATAAKPASKLAPKPTPKAPVKAVTSPAKKPAQAAKPTKVSKTAPVAKTVKAAKIEKTEKPKKAKLVRDSFSIPKDEYDALAVLKARGISLKRPVKKTELLRAGIKLLQGLGDAQFLKAIDQVPSLKTGRPLAEKTAETK